MSDDEKDNVIRVDFGGGAPPVEAPQPPTDPIAGQKLDLFKQLLEKGVVMLTLDARVPGVIVPQAFAGDLGLNLNFCYEFRIPDFDFDMDGVRASLSFSGRDHWCDIPWAAVWRMSEQESGELYVFPPSFPQEVIDDLQAMQDQEPDS